MCLVTRARGAHSRRHLAEWSRHRLNYDNLQLINEVADLSFQSSTNDDGDDDDEIPNELIHGLWRPIEPSRDGPEAGSRRQSSRGVSLGEAEFVAYDDHLDVRLLKWFQRRLERISMRTTALSNVIGRLRRFWMEEASQIGADEMVEQSSSLGAVDWQAGGDGRGVDRGRAVDESGSEGSNLNSNRSEQLGGGEEAGARRRLIGVLRVTKIINLLLLISNMALLIRAIDQSSLMKCWTVGKALNLQNLQRAGDSYSEVGDGSQSSSPPNSLMVAGSQPAASWRKASANCIGHSNGINNASASPHQPTLGVGLSRSEFVGTNICYYLLIVTLLDFLNSLHWRHSSKRATSCSRRRRASGAVLRPAPGKLSRGPLVSAVRAAAWLRSALCILTSPRHLFQAVHLSLLTTLAADSGALGPLAGLLNWLNQVVRHSLNVYRISCHLSALRRRRSPHEARGGQPEVASERAEGSAKLEESNLNGPTGTGSLSALDRWLIMSQIMGVKLSIFVILIQLDGLQFGGSLRSVALCASLVESFLALHSFYDNYHSRYIQPADQARGSGRGRPEAEEGTC